MTKRSLRPLLKLSAITVSAALALSAHATLQEPKQESQQDRRDRDDDRRDPTIAVSHGATAERAVRDADRHRGMRSAVLNPGLPRASFMREACGHQLGPDGRTLAVLTAGQNSLYKPDGTVDAANSTQSSFSTTSRAPTKPGPPSRKSSSR